MNSRYCLDTHPLIWYYQKKSTLSDRAKMLIRQGLSQKLSLVVPTMVLLESFHASLKDPLFRFPEFLQTLKIAQPVIASFDKKTLLTCYKLPRNINIHDRVIAATALTYNCPLITRDPVLAKLPGLKTVW